MTASRTTRRRTRTRPGPARQQRDSKRTAAPNRAPTRHSLWKDDRTATIALLVLIAVGAALRLAMFAVQSPGFIGISDSTFYVIATREGVFSLAADAGNAWPAGYPIFLSIVHGIADQLTLLIVVQHLLGIATAVLAFLTVRLVAPAAWGLIPAALVLLAGPQLFLEHTPMTESLFAFLVAAFTYSALRARFDRPLAWGALAGFCAAATASVRVTGLAYIVLLVVWLLAGDRTRLRRRAIGAAAIALTASLVLGLYLAEMKRQTGFGGPALTRTGDYGTPDAGGSFSYWDRLGEGLPRFWSSDDGHAPGEKYEDEEIGRHGYDYEGMVQIMGTPTPSSVAAITASYPTANSAPNLDALDTMQSYESHTRVEGPLFMLLLLIGLGGLALSRGRRLAAGLLVAGVLALTLLLPILYVYFDARYVVPGYASLGILSAIGGATLWERLAPLLEGRLRVLRQRPTPATAPS